MDFLLILFIALAILSGIGVAFLYISKNSKTKNLTFYCLILLSLIITALNVTSLPSNYLMERIIAMVLGAIALPGLIIKLKAPQKTSTADLLVTVSVLGGLIYLFFF